MPTDVIRTLRSMGIGPSRLRKHSATAHPKGDETGRVASGAVCRVRYVAPVAEQKTKPVRATAKA